MTLHHPGVSMYTTEVVPYMAKIAELRQEATNASNELFGLLQTFGPTQSCILPSRSIINVVVWKRLEKNWNNLSDYGFIPPLKGRKLVGGLSSDMLLENPLLPDLLLSERYNPYELNSDKSLTGLICPITMLNDPPFQPLAKDLLCKLLKAVILRNNLIHCWLQTGILQSKIFSQKYLHQII